MPGANLMLNRRERKFPKSLAPGDILRIGQVHILLVINRVLIFNRALWRLDRKKKRDWSVTAEGRLVAFFRSTARQMRIQNFVAVLVLILAASGAAQAQWEHATFPGTPHKPDGTVDLTAPVPRTKDGKVDLSGVWSAIDFSWVSDLPGKGVTPPMTPAAAQIFDERLKSRGEHNPQLYCMPHSLPDAMLVADIPFKIIETPIETVVLFEEFNQYVQIYTDGRTLAPDPNPRGLGIRPASGTETFSSSMWRGSRKAAGLTTSAIRVPNRCMSPYAFTASISETWMSIS